MPRVQVNGDRYVNSSDAEPVDRMVINLSDTEGGPLNDQVSYFAPDSPNSGSSEDVVYVWNDDRIEVEVPASKLGKYVIGVYVNDIAANYVVNFDLEPDVLVPGTPPVMATVTTVNQPQPEAYNSRYVHGTGLDGPGLRLRVISDDTSYDKVFYLDDPGSNAPGLGASVFSENQVQIDDSTGDLQGALIDYVQVRDSSNSVIFEWYASSQPTIFNICSPSADTFRIEGKGFQNSPLGPVGYVIARLADYGPLFDGPYMQYEFADGSPDPVYDWVLNEFTDTVIEISNPKFSSVEPYGGPGDFVMTGVAFHSPTSDPMYYFEPWGESFYQPVNGAGNCSASTPLTATIDDAQYLVGDMQSGSVVPLDCDDIATAVLGGQLVVVGSGFEALDPTFGIRVITTTGMIEMFNTDAVSYSDTQIVIDQSTLAGRHIQAVEMLADDLSTVTSNQIGLDLIVSNTLANGDYDGWLFSDAGPYRYDSGANLAVIGYTDERIGSVTLIGCGGENIVVYDPLGPNAGDNDPDFGNISWGTWDDGGVTIEHLTLFPFPLHSVEYRRVNGDLVSASFHPDGNVGNIVGPTISSAEVDTVNRKVTLHGQMFLTAPGGAVGSFSFNDGSQAQGCMSEQVAYPGCLYNIVSVDPLTDTEIVIEYDPAVVGVSLNTIQINGEAPFNWSYLHDFVPNVIL